LLLALECDRPLSGPARFSLAELDVVRLGRAELDRRTTSEVDRQLTLGVPDGRMSGEHAKLVCVAGQWLIEDLGSKNGTFVGGVAIKRGLLADGDIIETGHSLWRFAEAAPRVRGDQPTCRPQPGLRTFSTRYATELRRLQQIAQAEIAVLLRGESGSGKELAARAVHELSGRAGRFVPVNCAALVKTLVQSELFGYRRGAFSGANEDRVGLIASADGGTLFLDEIGDLPLDSQAVLLRVLQEGQVKPVGATETLSVDVRVVSATHRDLEAMIADELFRADLYARLAGMSLQVLALRERPEDIGMLIAELLRRHGGSASDLVSFDADAGRALLSYGWPLNVRELEQCLASAVVLAGQEPIALEHLAPAVRAALDKQPAEVDRSVGGDAEEALSDEDQQIHDQLCQALSEHCGNISAVARALGKDRKQIHRWVRRFRLSLRDYRSHPSKT